VFFFANGQFPVLLVMEEFLELSVVFHRYKSESPCSALQGSVFDAFLGQRLRNLFQMSRLFFIFIKVRCHDASAKIDDMTGTPFAGDARVTGNLPYPDSTSPR
jgi:hypothetical protein